MYSKYCNTQFFVQVIMKQKKEYDTLKSRVQESSTAYLKFSSDEIPQVKVIWKQGSEPQMEVVNCSHNFGC